jgi:uncharacterized tellurite resistance protein B-like protein
VHILAIIISVLVGIGVWWWRIQRARAAASAMLDMAGKAKGAISRARFKAKTGVSVLAAVEDPGTAAATLLYSISAMKRPVSLADEDRIDGLLERVCRMNKIERADALAFAAWAAVEVADTNEVVRRFLPLWDRTLEEEQRRELIDIALEIAEAGGAPNDAQAASIKKLSEGLFVR